MLNAQGLWSRATCTDLLCHKFCSLGPHRACFLISKWGCSSTTQDPHQALRKEFTKGELAGWTQVRAQQTQAAIIRSSVKPSLKAACGLRHLGPSAPRLFTENLLCARHRTGASPWTGRQVIPPPGLVSSRTYLKGLLHRTQDTTGAPQRTDHALSHQPGSDLGPSGWPFRSWSLIRCWHSGVVNQHRSHSTQEPPPTTEEKDKSIKRPRSPLKTRSRGSAPGDGKGSLLRLRS